MGHFLTCFFGCEHSFDPFATAITPVLPRLNLGNKEFFFADASIQA